MACALVERASSHSRAVIPLLQSLYQTFPEKAVQKAVKRAVFKLRTKGIFVSLAGKKEASAGSVLPRENEVLEAALSAIDGMGNRAVFLALPRMPKGFVVGVGILNDEKGMVHFQAGWYGKKRMREVRRAFSEQVENMVPVSFAHAVTVLERAYARGKETQENAQSGYLEVRPLMLEGVDLLTETPLPDLLPKDEIPSGPLTDGQLDTLFGHRLFASWVIPPDEIQPLLDSFDRAANSPILLSGAQRLERELELKTGWLTAHYPDSRRLVLKERLEETAYVLYGLGERETALLALAAAADLGRPVSSLRRHSVPAHLLDRTLRLYEREKGEAAREKDETVVPGSRILIP
jgi:hypothetical protein